MAVWTVTRFVFHKHIFQLFGTDTNGDEQLLVCVEDVTDLCCCEDPGVTVCIHSNYDIVEDKDDLDDYLGGTIQSIKLLETMEGYENSPVVMITLREKEDFETITLVVEPYNNHRHGYYPHDFVYQIWKECHVFEVGKSPIDLEEVSNRLKHVACI